MELPGFTPEEIKRLIELKQSHSEVQCSEPMVPHIIRDEICQQLRERLNMDVSPVTRDIRAQIDPTDAILTHPFQAALSLAQVYFLLWKDRGCIPHHFACFFQVCPFFLRRLHNRIQKGEKAHLPSLRKE